VRLLIYENIFISADLGDPTRAYIPGWNNEAVTDAWPEEGHHYLSPLFRRNGSMDRPDLKDPVFSSCHVPLIWLPAWLFPYAEFFANSFVPLWLMQDKKLIDNKIDLVPFAAGFVAPTFVEQLLRPYTTGIISDFHSYGSREHVFNPKWPRCFKKILLCEFYSMYRGRPGPKFNATGDPLYPDNITYDGDPDFEKIYKPSSAGQYVRSCVLLSFLCFADCSKSLLLPLLQLVQFYKDEGLVNPPKREEDIFHILVASRNEQVRYRNLLNLTVFLEECHNWVLPQNSGYKGVKCYSHAFGQNFFTDVEQAHNADVLVGHHGAELNNAFFMKNGSSVVEIRMVC
jgi:hypothetical protein